MKNSWHVNFTYKIIFLKQEYYITQSHSNLTVPSELLNVTEYVKATW